MRILFSIAAAWLFVCGAASAQAPSIQEFSRLSEFRGASLSPSGRYVAGIVRSEAGDRLVIIDWTTNTVTPIAQAAQDLHSWDVSINWVFWKTDDRLVYSITALDGRENLPGTRRRAFSRVQSLNRSGGDIQEMLNRDYSMSSIVLADRLPSDPDHVLIQAADNSGVGLFRANVNDGEERRQESSSRYIGDWWINRDGEATLRLEFPRDRSGYRIARRAPGSNEWHEVREILARSFEENRDFIIIGPGPRPELMYVSARLEGASQFNSIYLFNTATGEFGEPVVQAEHTDIFSVEVMPGTYEVFSYCTYVERLACAVRQHQAEWAGIAHQLRQFGDVSLSGVSDDGQTWLIFADGPTNPGFFAVYSRASQSLSVISRVRSGLTAERLNPVEVLHYQTRDGVDLFGYLTRPRGVTGPLPLIVFPHGGPEDRDYLEYDFVTQFLASRGYAVFQPQFRGSEGFGREFATQGYGQWGGRMQDDITDSVRHLTEVGIAQPGRVCIAGISYGGYAALQGAVSTPDLYRCAVGIAGVYDLVAFANDERRTLGSESLAIAYVRRTLGTVSDRNTLVRISPSRNAGSVRIPILLIHGEEDFTADILHSERMRDALQEAGANVRYVEVPNVRHPFTRWRERENTLLLTELETFFAANLGSAN
jgi:acetyl esterase/lipase